MKKKFYLVVALLVFSGCVFVAQEFNEKEAEKLAFHMSEKDVTKHMGTPSKVEILTIEGKKYEAWRYPIERKFAKRFNALDTSYYEVLFSEGKVVRWKRVKRYSQPEYDLKPLVPEGKVKTYEFFKGKEGKE